jgi:sec-independent protein translocase protein TatB
VFGNIGWGEFMILLVAALVILGPERLPGAVSWISKSLRQVREYAGGATQQLKDELGPEFDDLRKPLSELNQLRGMTPRAAITKHLLDGDDSIFTGNFDDKKSSGANGSAPTPKPTTTPLGDGDKPPIDIDAT